MKHIVINIQPFDAKQTVSIYMDGICIKTAAIEYDKLPEEIYAFSKQYKIYNIDIRGQESYSLKLKQDLLVPKYNKEHQFNITLY